MAQPSKSRKKATDGTTSDGLSSLSCEIQETNDGSPAGLSNALNFTVAVENYKNEANAKASINATKSSDKIGDKVYFIRTDVPGIADEAFFFQGQAPATLKSEEFMYARKNNQVIHLVAVRLSGIDHEKVKTQITEVAKKSLN